MKRPTSKFEDTSSEDNLHKEKMKFRQMKFRYGEAKRTQTRLGRLRATCGYSERPWPSRASRANGSVSRGPRPDTRPEIMQLQVSIFRCPFHCFAYSFGYHFLRGVRHLFEHGFWIDFLILGRRLISCLICSTVLGLEHTP